MENQSISLEELSQLGQKIYTDLRETLEKDAMGNFVVIDVENGEYAIDADRLIAIDKAKEKFGDKLFYIIQIGASHNPSVNFSEQKYAWNFQ